MPDRFAENSLLETVPSVSSLSALGRRAQGFRADAHVHRAPDPFVLGTTRGSGTRMVSTTVSKCRGKSKEFSTNGSPITRALSTVRRGSCYCCQTKGPTRFSRHKCPNELSPRERSPRQHNWTPVGRGTEPRWNE